jgi:hypothetical protein
VVNKKTWAYTHADFAFPTYTFDHSFILAEMLQAHPAAGSNQCLKLQGRSFGWLSLDTRSWIMFKLGIS